MTIQTTQWSPDHCACVLAYTWDDTVPQDTRTHTASRIVNQCAAHTGMGLVPHFAALLDENQRKNKVYGAILSQLPTLTTTDTRGGVILRAGVTFTYSFDAQRNLLVTITGATAAQKNAMQTWCDTNLGAGKIVVS